MNNLKYENDVRALLMAFYHGEKIIVNPGPELPEPDTLCRGGDGRVPAVGEVCRGGDDGRAPTVGEACRGGDKNAPVVGESRRGGDGDCILEMRLRFADDRIEVSVGAPGDTVGVREDSVGASGDTVGEQKDSVGAQRESVAVLKDSVATDLADYKQTKNDLKRLVYRVMCAFTGQTLPWGTLTGIRPTKIAMQLMDAGMDDAKMRDFFDREYRISEAKYRLCTTVAANERRILKDAVSSGECVNSDFSEPLRGFSLYVGIPFCPTICAYCSFSSYPLGAWRGRVDDYLEVLFKEIDAVSDMLCDAQGGAPKPLTFYMGGGTPTSLSAAQMDQLLTKLEQHFRLDQVREKTIEAGRPDSITADKLEVIRAHGITRISINPQTMNERTLEAIGRRHSVEQVREAYALARSHGFDNINMDLIAGLPGEHMADFENTLSEIRRMAPESLTVHALAIKRAARVNREKLYLQSAPVAEVSEMIDRSFETATEMGMAPYYLYRQKNIAGNLENVGYAKPGFEALYNILIMEEKQSIIALGAGGTTKLVYPGENRIERAENVKSVKDYMERCDEMIGRKRRALEALRAHCPNDL